MKSLHVPYYEFHSLPLECLIQHKPLNQFNCMSNLRTSTDPHDARDVKTVSLCDSIGPVT